LVARGLHRVRGGPLLGEVHDRVGALIVEEGQQLVVVAGDVEDARVDRAAGDLLPRGGPLVERADRRERADLELLVDAPPREVVGDRDVVTTAGQGQTVRPTGEAV